MISPSVLPADAIQDTEVDWGTGTDQVNAGDIPDEGTDAAHKVILTKADKDKVHTQGTDTSLGTQASALDMGGNSIDDINVVNLKALTCAVHNNTGATLVAGIGVYPTGEVSNVVAVAKCDNTDKDKMPCLGIVSTDIADGDTGKVVRCGIKGMNTSGFTGSVGDRVYIQSDGTLDTVEPTSGSVQRIGILVVKAASGKIYIHFRGRKSINASSDEHPIIRMGDDIGHKKVSFHKYDNTEMAYIDDSAIMKIASLTDGTDSATIANLKDAVDKKHTQGTDAGLDTGGGNAITAAEAKAKMDNPMTAAGDIIVGGASGVASKLAKGSDDEVLTLASGTPSWAAAAGGSVDFLDKFRRYYLSSSIDGYTKTVDGGGTVEPIGLGIEYKTDSSINNRAYLVSDANVGFFTTLVETGKLVTVEWILRYSSSHYWQGNFMFVESVTPFSAVSNTENHFGFSVDSNGNVLANNGHATAYTETDTTINIAETYEILRMKIVLNPGTNCLFYVNGVLRATHTTNLPTAGAMYFLHQGIRASSTGQKTVRFDRIFLEKEY